MKFIKTILSSRITLIISANILYYIVRLIGLFLRLEISNFKFKDVAKKHNANGAFLYALWHQDILSALLAHGKKFGPHMAMVSQSNDGEVLSIALKKFGQIPVRGSSSRGGKSAMLEIIKNSKKGIPAVLTVDGPRGPAKIVKSGIIEIARTNNLAIIPVGVKYSKYFEFSKSWDKFKIPHPFAKTIINYGEPIVIPSEISNEEFELYRQHLADAINKAAIF